MSETAKPEDYFAGEKVAVRRPLVEVKQLSNLSASSRTVVFESLYRKHWKDLCRTLHCLYGAGPPDPEDVAQEAFSRYQRLESTSHIQDHKAFIYKVAFNVSLKSIAHIAKTRAFITSQINEMDEGLDEISPEKIVQDQQRIDALQRGAERLNPKQREILVRCRIKGQTYKEISTSTGWSISEISRQLIKALEILESESNH